MGACASSDDKAQAGADDAQGACASSDDKAKAGANDAQGVKPVNSANMMATVDAELKVAVVGDTGSGKRSLVSNLIDGTFWQGCQDPHEEGSLPKLVFRERILQVCFSDRRQMTHDPYSPPPSPWQPISPEDFFCKKIGGQDPARVYLYKARLVLVLVDITKQSALKDAKPFLERIKVVQDEINSSVYNWKHVSAVTILLGSKADLEEERQVSRADAEAFALSWRKTMGCNVTYMEISAKTSEGIAHAISTGVELVHEKEDIFEKYQREKEEEDRLDRRTPKANPGGIHSNMGCTVS